MENSRQHLLLRTDILQKIVVGCPCEMMIFYLNYQLFTAHRSVGLQFLLWKALDVYNPKAEQVSKLKLSETGISQSPLRRRAEKQAVYMLAHSYFMLSLFQLNAEDSKEYNVLVS